MGASARTVAARKAQLGGAPVFLYRLAWATPVLGGKLRTPHSLDMPMVFDNVAGSTSLVGTATRDPQRVADAMSAAWIAFARSGSPNGPGLAEWPAYDPQRRQTMSFDVVSRAFDDPLRREHDLLALADEPVVRAPKVACAALAGKGFYNVTVTAAVEVPAAGPVPAYCLVSGHEPGTAHDLEVRLPLQWRGRYVQRGGGGFDGSIPAAASAPAALQLGAVQGANNGGHRDPSGAALLHDPRATERYAHAAILTATRFGKAVTQAYYGAAPDHSYYDGCSNGGRGALNAAAKYGSEFDGIVAMAPTLNMTGIVPAMARFGALALPSSAQFAAVHDAVVARCDALDGLKDGIVSHWQACRVDPARDLPASIGLSAPQIEALRVLWSGLRRADGSVLYEGLGYGDLTAGAAIYERFGMGHLRNVVHDDASWSPPGGALDVERELPAIRATLEDRYQFSASVEGLAQYLHPVAPRYGAHPGSGDGGCRRRGGARQRAAVRGARREPLRRRRGRRQCRDAAGDDALGRGEAGTGHTGGEQARCIGPGALPAPAVPVPGLAALRRSGRRQSGQQLFLRDRLTPHRIQRRPSGDEFVLPPFSPNLMPSGVRRHAKYSSMACSCARLS
jgi:hypothetical protein